MKRITQSMLGNADKCLLSLQYNLDPPPWVERTGGAERAVGTGYHAGLEMLYGNREQCYPDPTLSQMVNTAVEVFDISTETDLYDDTPITVFKWSEKIPDRETAHTVITSMLTSYMEGGHAWPADWTVLAVEANHTVTIDGHDYKLGADLVLQDPNGWIVLVDHKTAGKAWDQHKHLPRKNNQGSLYTELAKHVWPEAPGHRFVFDVMCLPNKSGECKFERRICDPQPEHGKVILKKATDLVFLYETVHVKAGMDLPANPASTLCNPKWCDFFTGCPHGAALDN